jgi:cytochrome c
MSADERTGTAIQTAWRPPKSLAGVALFAAAVIATGCCHAAESSGPSDVTRGAAAFVRQCALCHTKGRGEPNRFGPNLFGMIDRQAGSVAGYQYSPAFRSTATWTWSAGALGGFISAPARMVPGTRMGVFQGVSDADRDAILAFVAEQK